MRMLAPLLCGFGIYTWKGITLSLTLAPEFVWMRPRLRESALSLGTLRNTPSFSLLLYIYVGQKTFFLFSQFINIKMWHFRERRAAKGTTKE